MTGVLCTVYGAQVYFFPFMELSYAILVETSFSKPALIFRTLNFLYRGIG